MSCGVQSEPVRSRVFNGGQARSHHCRYQRIKSSTVSIAARSDPKSVSLRTPSAPSEEPSVVSGPSVQCVVTDHGQGERTSDGQRVPAVADRDQLPGVRVGRRERAQSPGDRFLYIPYRDIYPVAMRIIAKRTLRTYWESESRAEQPLKAWYAIAAKADWSSPADVKAVYGNASIVGNDRVVFNIGGTSTGLSFASTTYTASASCVSSERTPSTTRSMRPTSSVMSHKYMIY